jgi:molybdenum cofactor cytidylyltransferase
MIAAIILAAGLSRRMGEPKMLLPWGKISVIEHVLSVFIAAGVRDIVVVTGGAQQEVEKVTEPYPVQRVHNSDHASGEMLSSLQCGLRALTDETEAALIGLGDQPQVEARTVRLVCDSFRDHPSGLVVPSFNMRRGHPWLVARSLWGELLNMQPQASPRDFLNRHAAQIQYVETDTSSILADLDTPQDYRRARPGPQPSGDPN